MFLRYGFLLMTEKFHVFDDFLIHEKGFLLELDIGFTIILDLIE